MWNSCLKRNLANYQEGKDYNHYICGFNALMNNWKSAIMFDKKILNLDWSCLNEFLLSFQFLQKFFSAFDIWMNCQLLCHNFYFKLQRKNSLGLNWIVNCHIIISISHLKLEACVSRFVAYVHRQQFWHCQGPTKFSEFSRFTSCERKQRKLASTYINKLKLGPFEFLEASNHTIVQQ